MYDIFAWPMIYGMKLQLFGFNKTLEVITLEDPVGTGDSFDTELGCY